MSAKDNTLCHHLTVDHHHDMHSLPLILQDIVYFFPLSVVLLLNIYFVKIIEEKKLSAVVDKAQ